MDSHTLPVNWTTNYYGHRLLPARGGYMPCRDCDFQFTLETSEVPPCVQDQIDLSVCP